MPRARSKPPKQPDFLKRRTFEEGKAQIDAAHVATWRLYCDTLAFWRRCANALCKRHRLAPASHVEWTVRRSALAMLTSWKIG